MRLTRRLSPAASLVSAAAILLSCHESTGPASGARGVAGRYVLESVSGSGAATGTVTLGATGTAERRVRYRLNTGGLSAEYVALGSYRALPSGALEIALREGSGPPASIWRPQAEIADGVLRLRYPNPADGPTIEEAYRRQ